MGRCVAVLHAGCTEDTSMNESASDDLDFSNLVTATAASRPDLENETVTVVPTAGKDAAQSGSSTEAPALSERETLNAGRGPRNDNPGAGARAEAGARRVMRQRRAPHPGVLAMAAATPDAVVLHTRQALAVLGDPAAPGPSGYGMTTDAWQFARAVRAIWALTANDNPCADWMLVRIDGRLAAMRQAMAATVSHCRSVLAGREQQGLHLSLLTSTAPVTIPFPVDHPYGYAAMGIVVEFDSAVRLIKTLVLKDCISDGEGFRTIRRLQRSFYRLFGDVQRWSGKLSSPSMNQLVRNDYLRDTDRAACARVQVASDWFGPMPRDVFLGTLSPRHTLRFPKVEPERLEAFDRVSRAWPLHHAAAIEDGP